MEYNLTIFHPKVCNDITATSAVGNERNPAIPSPGEGSCLGGDEEAVDIKHESLEPCVDYPVSLYCFKFLKYRM